MNKYGQIIGMTMTDEVVLLNQQDKPKPYELQDLFVLEDEFKNIYPVEITKSVAFGDFELETIQGIIAGESTLHLEGVDKSKPVYVGWAKSLKDLTTAIPPNSIIRKATFDEVKEHIIFADVDKSFHLGTIKGTENMLSELPGELKNIAPMWDGERNTVTEQDGVPFMFDYMTLSEYPHKGLFGSSGSGKSFGMHSMIEEYMKKRIPGIYLDPHNEGVFEKVMNGLPKEHQQEFKGKYKVFKVGHNIGIPFSKLNIGDLYYLLEFAGGVSDAQRAALDAIYERGDTFSYLMDKLDKLKEAFDYYDLPEWKRPMTEEEFKDLHEEEALLYEKSKKRVANVSVIEALTWRLLSLESRDVFDEKNGIDGVVATIKSGHFAMIQGSIGKLQMISAYLIRTLYTKRRMYVDSKDNFSRKHEQFPPFVIAGDEFQNFAPNSEYSTPTGRIIREIAKEARKYGVYLIVSTQQTSAIDPAVFAQLNTKFIYRLNSQEDIELTSREANLSPEQTKQISKLPRGHAFVVNPKIPRTILMKFRTTFTEPSVIDNPFDELQDMFKDNSSDIKDVLNFMLDSRPIEVASLPSRVLKVLKDELGRSVGAAETIKALDEMVEGGTVERLTSPVVTYRKKV